ncbi:hypothetical protein BJY04DRAFT_222565 [Aspergillus karnatakaensis]|uniref:uncharacterized protein n=1 Tax=Aspergillus karnatakaensis TaxID=1810916 RepID=UPI003CCD2005
MATALGTIHSAPPALTRNIPPILDICAMISASQVRQQPTTALGFLVDEANLNYEHRIYLTKDTLSGHELKSLRGLLATSDPLRQLRNQRSFLTRRDRLYLAANLACNVFQLHGSWLKADWKTEDIYVTDDANDERPVLDSLALSLPLSDIPVDPEKNPHADEQSCLIRNPILFPLGLALVELSLSQTLSDLRIAADHDPVDAIADLKTAAESLPIVQSESGITYTKVVKKCLFGLDADNPEIDSIDFQEDMYYSVIKPLLDDLTAFDGC